MSSPISQKYDVPPIKENSINLKLPAEIITYIFSFLPILGRPKTDLTCRHWHQIVISEWNIHYKMIERPVNGEDWFHPSNKMIQEGCYYHAFFFAIEIKKIFSEVIQRPTSPTTLSKFKASQPSMEFQECAGCAEKLYGNLNSFKIDSELKKNFWITLNYAVQKENIYYLLKTFKSMFPYLSKDELVEAFDRIKSKVDACGREQAKEQIDSWIKKHAQVKDDDGFSLFINELYEIIDISCAETVKHVTPQPLVYIACLEDSDEMQSEWSDDQEFPEISSLIPTQNERNLFQKIKRISNLKLKKLINKINNLILKIKSSRETKTV